MLPYESALHDVLREVRDSPFLRVVHEKVGPGGSGGDVSGLFEILEEDGFPIEKRLQEAYFPYRYFSLYWVDLDSSIDLAGEFSVMNIVVSSERKLLNLDDFSWHESDRKLLSELSIVDDISRGGNGQLATMRFRHGVSNPEVWYLDRFHTYVKLDLDYRGYLDQLFVTKGVLGWQYLFADVALGEREYENVVRNLRMMLDMFPRYFPGWDYSPLAERLEARL
ncbi:hypothetical protein [Saccharopolyspora gloriosae]|uniref:hypothetical protein n=1 Tax=Saccharopolyspora gloriosae TaxID=455344 RepID=UPI001FB67F87|nr:hypothetical protein [Saccharopolyspora gloriosae]